MSFSDWFALFTLAAICGTGVILRYKDVSWSRLFAPEPAAWLTSMVVCSFATAIATLLDIVFDYRPQVFPSASWAFLPLSIYIWARFFPSDLFSTSSAPSAVNP